MFLKVTWKNMLQKRNERVSKRNFFKIDVSRKFFFKYIDYLGIGLIYLSIITFVLIFMRDMKKIYLVCSIPSR